MYKITFEMLAPIIYYDLPIFDSVIAYCKYQEYKQFSDYHTPHGDEIIEFELPFIKHELGFYLASYMCFNENIEGEDAWRKQWESKYDDIVDFGKAQRKINVGSGQFKSYDIPFVTYHSKQVWFYFDGDKDAIEHLVKKYLNGLGKKSVIGYGNFSKFNITESDQEQMVYYRPLPLPFLKGNLKKLEGFTLTSKNGRIFPPYWLPAQEKVIIPSIKSS